MSGRSGGGREEGGRSSGSGREEGGREEGVEKEGKGREGEGSMTWREGNEVNRVVAEHSSSVRPLLL